MEADMKNKVEREVEEVMTSSVGHQFQHIHMIDVYQTLSRQTAIYPGAGQCTALGLSYVSLGLAGEAGEVANKIKKVIRDEEGVLTDEKAEVIAAELGDVVWYLARLADELGVSLSSVLAGNVNKLFSRKKRGVIGGSGDNR